MSNISENIACNKNVVSYTITNIQTLANQVNTQKTATEDLMWLNSFTVAIEQGIGGIRAVIPHESKDYWLYSTMIINPLESILGKVKAIAQGLNKGDTKAFDEYPLVLTALATMDDIVESI